MTERSVHKCVKKQVEQGTEAFVREGKCPSATVWGDLSVGHLSGDMRSSGHPTDHGSTVVQVHVTAASSALEICVLSSVAVDVFECTEFNP